MGIPSDPLPYPSQTAQEHHFECIPTPTRAFPTALLRLPRETIVPGEKSENTRIFGFSDPKLVCKNSLRLWFTDPIY
jgi:hypothetical protein